jgi:hypothetical protein
MVKNVKLFDLFIFNFLERSVSQPINMPNRALDPTLVYADQHSAVFSPKSTDPTNLGVNMCINILEGDNSPRVKDNTIKDVSQRLQNMKIYVSKLNIQTYLLSINSSD